MSQQGSASGVGACGGGRGGRGGGSSNRGGGRGSGDLGSGGRDQSVSGGGGRGGGDRSGASVDLHSLSRVRGSSRGHPPMFGRVMTPAKKMRRSRERKREAMGELNFFISHDSLPNDI